MFFQENINSIPEQFRQYNNQMENKNIDLKIGLNENISNNNDIQKESIANITKNKKCSLTNNDRIFVFLILAIFFDIL